MAIDERKLVDLLLQRSKDINANAKTVSEASVGLALVIVAQLVQESIVPDIPVSGDRYSLRLLGKLF